MINQIKNKIKYKNSVKIYKWLKPDILAENVFIKLWSKNKN